MSAPHLQTLWLGSILAAVLSPPLPSCAAGPPVWQPYREAFDPPALPVAVPAQYVVAEPMEGLPVDALTDADLNAMGAVCCEPYAGVDPHYDPIIGLPVTSSEVVLTNTSGEIELLPSGVIWQSYWAGAKEPRISGTVFREFGDRLSLLDVTLGGRTAVLRDAARDCQGLWYGWELQLEGAANLRLNLNRNWDFDAVDFRFGVPFILARNRVHYKIAYYHLSSHVGDEFLVRNPMFTRINFSRDVLVFGGSYYPWPGVRTYAEAGWAFYDDEGSDPWEFQFGIDLAQPGPTGTRGTPFAAFNGHLREEVRFGGNFVVHAGWLWRGHTGRVLRAGLHYYNGKSSQFEFFDQFEQQLGLGLWHDY